ncbi:MAG TPA: sigma-54 dependent transcriptional regulator [Polyangiaceae bacterium]|nr:sigma-54 dependent transcriptional regulator [Polyangiaceae bacterium]
MQVVLVVVQPGPPDDASVATLLERSGAATRVVGTVEEALDAAHRDAPDAVVLDADALGSSLADVIGRFDGVDVLVAGRGGAKQAVLAVRSGARDYLEVPFDADDLGAVTDKLLAAPDDDRSVDAPNSTLLGASKPMQQVHDLIRRIAATDATALVRGESGTGKELVARALHEQSPRSHAPFIKLHCAGLPETLLESELFGHERGAFTGATHRKPGRVEVAEGGTLFFDEIGDISAAMQVKLLRLLQDRQYERLGGTSSLTADVRFIAATHRDLEHMVKKGEFREDLFYRLNVVPIWLPPLRARRSDVVELATRFCDTFARRHGKAGATLSPEALGALGRERWPGNVRQLQNFVERLVVLADSPLIGAADVTRELAPENIFSTDGAAAPAASIASPSGLTFASRTGPIVPLDATLRAAERSAIVRALAHVKGNRALAARLLGVGRATLYKKIAELGIE